MSNTQAQKNAEQYIIRKYLKPTYSQDFLEKPIPLKWGGKFKPDAISEDGKIAAVISTSRPRTASGKSASGKFHKMRSDALFLLNLKGVNTRLMIFTEKDMYDYFIGDQEHGRFPNGIELMHCMLDKKHQVTVEDSRKRASREMS